MFKRFSGIMLTFTILGCVLCSVPVQAYDDSKPFSAVNMQVVDVEHLENGDYIETVLITNNNGSADASILSSTKSGAKTKNYKNSSGAIMWSVTVRGTFSYTGSSATCTSATRSTSAPGTTWSIKSSSVSKSGNTATAKATATHTYGTTSNDISMSVSLSCSANGTLS